MILLVIGVTIPAVSVLLSALLGSAEDLFKASIDADVSAEGFGLFEVLFPLSPIIWCVQLIVMGSVGEMLRRSGNFDIVPIWIIAIIAGYIGMLIVNNCIMLPLKRAKIYTDSIECLIGMQAEVIETIKINGTGAVKIIGKAGQAIYAAKCEDSIQINQEEIVRVNNIINGVATVEREVTD